MVQLWCSWGGNNRNNRNNGQISPYRIDTMDSIVLSGQGGQVTPLIKSQLIHWGIYRFLSWRLAYVRYNY